MDLPSGDFLLEKSSLALFVRTAQNIPGLYVYAGHTLEAKGSFLCCFEKCGL